MVSLTKKSKLLEICFNVIIIITTIILIYNCYRYTKYNHNIISNSEPKATTRNLQSTVDNRIVIDDDLIQLMAMDQQTQLELAMKLSLHEKYRIERKQQDIEYEKELSRTERQQQKQKEMNDDSAEPKIEKNKQVEKKNEDNNDDDYVLVRARLPNGIKIQKNFTKTANIHDVRLWIKNEYRNNDQKHSINLNNLQLISTMPRIVYDDNDKTLQELGFWFSSNTKKRNVSPELFVQQDC